MSEPTGLGRYDAVLCCEVLEHLLVAPEHLLAWLRAHLSERGVLVVQTPNAAALDRRMKLLAGRQPYDRARPRSQRGTPRPRVHLHRAARIRERRGPRRRARATRHAYFDYRFSPGAGGTARRLRHSAQNALDRALPPGLRSGITLVLRPLDRE